MKVSFIDRRGICLKKLKESFKGNFLLKREFEREVKSLVCLCFVIF